MATSGEEPNQRYGLSPLRIAVSGATGLIGEALEAQLTAGRHEIIRMVRKGTSSGHDAPGPTILWDPDSGTIDDEALAGVDVVIHLAGANIAGARWTEAQKKLIRDSRVNGTAVIANALARLDTPPRALICASAIGYYGDRGDEWLDETSARGDTFLAEATEAWEAAADPARQANVRTVHLRFGMVLSAAGGALEKMLGPFKLGIGGRIGDGRQYWSWIARDDVISAVLHAIATESLSGPVNVTTPDAPTNLEFTKTLGRVLARPTIAPLPAFAARLMLGEMADELLLCSARVRPARLLETGFEWRHPDLEQALRHTLGKPREPAVATST